MSPEQEAHIQAIIGRFTKEAYHKYAAGVAEHGGNLWDLSDTKLVEAAMEEAIDQYVYLYTLREKILLRLEMEQDLV